jgi:tripartite-type tricarboxylate transporter receptor subunit TctC
MKKNLDMKGGGMKKITFFISGVSAILYLTLLAHPVQSQTYPSHPIQMVIPMAAGDMLDLTGRAIASRLSDVLKTPVIPINKPGGGGTVGGDFVAKGKKDGYTILYGFSSVYIAHAMNPEAVPYNPLQDLEPLCLAVSFPLTLAVRADSPWKSFQDLVDYIKKNPGKVRGSTGGVGTGGHIGYEIIRVETGAAITMVPYKGASPAVTAILGGHVEVTSVAKSLLTPHIKAGTLRGLLNSQKVPEFPDIPTLTQLGYKRNLPSVRCPFFLPTGAPESVKNILSSALEESIKSPDVVNTIRTLGVIADYNPAEEFKKMMIEEYETVREFFKTAGPPGK